MNDIHYHEHYRVTCGNCHRSWCEKCDPAPSALCHWCHGRGYSWSPLPRPHLNKYSMGRLYLLQRRVLDFGVECEEHQYTDTEEAWELLREVEDVLSHVLGRPAEPSIG